MTSNDLRSGPYAGATAMSYSFNATGGDKITAEITVVGDAQAWITDATNNVLGTSAGSGVDTHVNVTLPPGPQRALNVVFKDRSGGSGTYRVKLSTVAGPCNPGAEPWHDYLGTPDECLTLHYSCPAPQHPFANACGCGCENPG
jgi:hypothetical protein